MDDEEHAQQQARNNRLSGQETSRNDAMTGAGHVFLNHGRMLR